ncbi:hypothetical protein H9Y04_36380 [Streptomyces sp. TRM66268-LWL]|uniref:Uncharacterized protein n=1 Tax=Streptomyces polyasparticus TaxID=2767826 RepID=A0ABR7SR88_9ACTN|nr:hypothetical protein [Streptomyces polyasparticus]MBC9718025.1 hypothetical protein [Streptomyces polyasparticus]
MLLLTATRHSRVLDGDAPLPPHLVALLATEAAWHLVATAGYTVSGLTDPNLAAYLARLDEQPLAVKTELLRTAARRLAPATTDRAERRVRAVATTGAPSRPGGRRAVDTCSCACTSGGFCGGCGHAGCGGGRR